MKQDENRCTAMKYALREGVPPFSLSLNLFWSEISGKYSEMGLANLPFSLLYLQGYRAEDFED